MKVILLAAGRGKRFGRRTHLRPKCLIPIGPSQTLLRRYLDAFRALGIRDVVLVVGHLRSQIRSACAKWGRDLSIRFITNLAYRRGSIVSLWSARRELDDDCLIMDADVYFEPRQLKDLLRSRSSAFLIDPRSKSAGEEMMLMARGKKAVHISKKVVPSLTILGEATGFLKLSASDAKLLADILDRKVRNGIKDAEYEEAYNDLMARRSIGTRSITGFWTEMDFEEDLKRIRQTLKT